MEKWAKSQNKKSKSSAPAPMAAPVTPDITTQAATAASNKQAAADMAYDVLMGNKKFAQPQTPSRVSAIISEHFVVLWILLSS